MRTPLILCVDPMNKVDDSAPGCSVKFVAKSHHREIKSGFLCRRGSFENRLISFFGGRNGFLHFGGMWAERKFFGRDLRSINLLIHATINGIVSEQVHVSPVIRQRFVNRCLSYEE